MTQVTNPQPDKTPAPKIEVCEVGPFRLSGVKVDTGQFTDAELAEMTAWVKDQGGYVGEQGLFSWKKAKLRDWFLLRWG